MDRFRRSLVHTNYIEMDVMVKDAGKDTRPILNFDIEKWQTWRSIYFIPYPWECQNWKERNPSYIQGFI